MQPLRGNVLSTVHSRTGLQQRLSKLIIFFKFVSLGFLSLFVYLFACLLVLAHDMF